MEEKTVSSKRIFEGRVVTLDLLEVELENGQRTQREVVRHPGGVGALARLPDGRFVLVRQFRKSIDRFLVEIVAGMREKGESAEVSARREVEEETGRRVASIRHLGHAYATPGYVDERIELFFAELEDCAAGLENDHDEHVEPVVMTRDEIEAAIRAGKIDDSKTLAIWLLFEKLVEGAHEQTG